jgi:5-carboxymethyl-2-hydroxymuconate isomerase
MDFRGRENAGSSDHFFDVLTEWWEGMPHLIVEYSANVAEHVDLDVVVRALHESALSTNVFELGSLRSRAALREIYRIADGHEDNSFCAVSIRMARGRDEDTRVRIGKALFETAKIALAAASDKLPLALSIEIQEIDPVGQFRQNPLHALMKARHGAARAP